MVWMNIGGPCVFMRLKYDITTQWTEIKSLTTARSDPLLGNRDPIPTSK